MVCVYLVFAWNNTYLEVGVGYALRIVFKCSEVRCASLEVPLR